MNCEIKMISIIGQYLSKALPAPAGREQNIRAVTGANCRSHHQLEHFDFWHSNSVRAKENEQKKYENNYPIVLFRFSHR